MNKFDIFCDFLIDENKKINLTAITNPEEIKIKHIYDSLSVSEYIKDDSKVLDIGSGAGFPGIVVKIENPSLDMTLIDSVNKKVIFMNKAISLLKLENIRAIHTRAEDFAIENKEKFDYVLTRAVSNLSTLAEISIPFLKINGIFIAMKGPNIKEEMEEAKFSINKMGGKIEKIVSKNIYGNSRNLVFVKKIKESPKGFPRSGNKAFKNPLKKI
ncbi:MAG: 16S rRNA (guanine(527)-N(7))-methyltransferase RsmG [Peptoniphilaceae bacterium]|nr:16S rRNA (guanine(527)-N(7))-methyltransferase RsmG [Peptoniphilaceae bacterium]MDY3738539.1 16S rRNA (guanine(527)-N(7))-methyltransferase RsmG [Peptoniphilaceae bacterium]